MNDCFHLKPEALLMQSETLESASNRELYFKYTVSSSVVLPGASGAFKRDLFS